MCNIDEELQRYWESIYAICGDGKDGKPNLPNFWNSGNRRFKKYLAILETPGNSGAVKSRQCSILNRDATSANQREAIIKAFCDGYGGMERISKEKSYEMVERDEVNEVKEILFWNFYPCYNCSESRTVTDKKNWGKELRKLCDVLPNLRVILVFGGAARNGMKYFEPLPGIPILYAPHPSARGLMLKGKRELLWDTWKEAKKIAES